MKRFAAWLLGAFAILGFLRRRREEHGGAEVDPRAEELRRKLAESREILEEREQFEGAETTVDKVEPAADPEARRRAVHDEARAAAERMRATD